MKSHAVLAILAIAVAGSVDAAGSSTGSAAAGDCSATEQTTAFASLASLLSTTSMTGCATDSGYSLTTSATLPTNDEYARPATARKWSRRSLRRTRLTARSPSRRARWRELDHGYHSIELDFDHDIGPRDNNCDPTSTKSASTTEAPATTTAKPKTSSATSLSSLSLPTVAAVLLQSVLSSL
ncbi:unnamed protein product [Phytophthora lilii]|uniref:Unnamed protein product n=1 Tax=Phytophthora lilii TaxID=2077276 RepID=A0A9W6U9P0_9STRA|nr:unnamed protein product [Phytophthora lilii]